MYQSRQGRGEVGGREGGLKRFALDSLGVGPPQHERRKGLQVIENEGDPKNAEQVSVCKGLKGKEMEGRSTCGVAVKRCSERKGEGAGVECMGHGSRIITECQVITKWYSNGLRKRVRMPSSYFERAQKGTEVSRLLAAE